LYSEGGIPRLYQGLSFAIIQGPLSRFGDTAANALVITLIDAYDVNGVLPIVVRTGLGSVVAGLWRVLLMPIDTAKTCLQVNGKNGLNELLKRINNEGFLILFNGGVAASIATIVGHFPWFLMFNYLSENLPSPQKTIENIENFNIYLENLKNSADASILNIDFSDSNNNDIVIKVDHFQNSNPEVLSFLTNKVSININNNINNNNNMDFLKENINKYNTLLNYQFLAFSTNIITIIDLKDILTKVDLKILELLRSAFIGLCSSSVSDVCSNSFRVLKTAKQTNMGSTININNSGDEKNGANEKILQKNLFMQEYILIGKTIIKEEGIYGLFGRGLESRLLSNALQGMMFSVLFKYFTSLQN